MTQQERVIPAYGTQVIDSFRLDGKVAVVTGASSGLGACVARVFAEAGAACVYVAARRLERLQDTVEVVRAAGGEAIAVPLDVTDPEACDAAVEEIVAHTGRLDVLVNSAGTGWAAPALKERPADFRRVVDTNLLGTYWMSQACARRMAPGGSIVNVGSVLGSTSFRIPQAAYAASKAGIVGLTLDLAQQWTGRYGIRVNAVAPGLFPSDMSSEYRPGVAERIVEERVPAGRMGTPDEMAAAVLFLASPAASYVTGVTLPVDGGLLVT